MGNLTGRKQLRGERHNCQTQSGLLTRSIALCRRVRVTATRFAVNRSFKALIFLPHLVTNAIAFEKSLIGKNDALNFRYFDSLTSMFFQINDDPSVVHRHFVPCRFTPPFSRPPNPPPPLRGGGRPREAWWRAPSPQSHQFLSRATIDPSHSALVMFS